MGYYYYHGEANKSSDKVQKAKDDILLGGKSYEEATQELSAGEKSRVQLAIRPEKTFSYNPMLQPKKSEETEAEVYARIKGSHKTTEQIEEEKEAISKQLSTGENIKQIGIYDVSDPAKPVKRETRKYETRTTQKPKTKVSDPYYNPKSPYFYLKRGAAEEKILKDMYGAKATATTYLTSKRAKQEKTVNIISEAQPIRPIYVKKAIQKQKSKAILLKDYEENPEKYKKSGIYEDIKAGEYKKALLKARDNVALVFKQRDIDYKKAQEYEKQTNKSGFLSGGLFLENLSYGVIKGISTPILYPKETAIGLGRLASNVATFSFTLNKEARARSVTYFKETGSAIKQSFKYNPTQFSGELVGGYFTFRTITKLPIVRKTGNLLIKRPIQAAYKTVNPRIISQTKAGVKLVKDVTIKQPIGKLKSFIGKRVETVHTTYTRLGGKAIKPASTELIKGWRKAIGQRNFYTSSPFKQTITKQIGSRYTGIQGYKTVSFSQTPLAPQYQPVVYLGYVGMGKGYSDSIVKYSILPQKAQAYIFRDVKISQTPSSVLRSGAKATAKYQSTKAGTYVPVENYFKISTEGQFTTAAGTETQSLFKIQLEKGGLSSKSTYVKISSDPPKFIATRPKLAKVYDFLTREYKRIHYREASFIKLRETTGTELAPTQSIAELSQPVRSISVISSESITGGISSGIAAVSSGLSSVSRKYSSLSKSSSSSFKSSPSSSVSSSVSSSLSSSSSSSISSSISSSPSSSVSSSGSSGINLFRTTQTTSFNYKNVIPTTKRERKKSIFKQRKAFTPTASALGLGLKGKTSKGAIRSGLGQRYIPIEKKKLKGLII